MTYHRKEPRAATRNQQPLRRVKFSAMVNEGDNVVVRWDTLEDCGHVHVTDADKPARKSRRCKLCPPKLEVEE